MRSSACCATVRDALELGRERRVSGDVPPGAAEERADGGDDLAEVVVQLARDRPLHVFLDAQRPPRQRSKLAGDGGDLGEGATVRGDDPGADAGSHEQQGEDEQQDLAPDLVVDGAVGRGRLFLPAVVDDEELRDQPVEGTMFGNERGADLLPRRRFVGPAEAEHAVDVTPVLRHRLVQALLLRRLARRDERALERRRLLEVAADAVHCRLEASAADRVRRASAMSRIIAASEARSFWMRSSCRAALRLRSLIAVCSSRSERISLKV